MYRYLIGKDYELWIIVYGLCIRVYGSPSLSRVNYCE